MKTKHTEVSIPSALIVLFALGVSFPANAEPSSASNDTSKDVVELSPFEVNASHDVGYQATNTLAGSRLNTALKDTAASNDTDKIITRYFSTGNLSQVRRVVIREPRSIRISAQLEF